MSEVGKDKTVEVELPRPATFTSGSVTGTVDEHLTLLKKTIIKGINAGVNAFIRGFIQKVIAEDTGTLRAALITEFRIAVLGILRTMNISDTDISFEVNIPDFPEYAVYHLDGTFGSAYKKPTTKGTRPSTMEEMAEEIELYIDIGMRAALTARGFDFE